MKEKKKKRRYYDYKIISKVIYFNTNRNEI